jgi:hypothetical protein
MRTVTYFKESRLVLNHGGNPMSLTTFFGVESSWACVLYANPIDLKEAAFNMTAATIDATGSSPSQLLRRRSLHPCAPVTHWNLKLSWRL